MPGNGNQIQPHTRMRSSASDDPHCTVIGIMPVIEDQITTPPAGIMPIMQVIEAQRASILVPHDHLHNNQTRTTSALRSTRSVVPWLTIGGQPPAAQIGGSVSASQDQPLAKRASAIKKVRIHMHYCSRSECTDLPHTACVRSGRIRPTEPRQSLASSTGT
jgi:hypothetical protein